LRAAVRSTHGGLIVSRSQLIEEGLLTPKVGREGGREGGRKRGERGCIEL